MIGSRHRAASAARKMPLITRNVYFFIALFILPLPP
jgi:hypothetical protein